MSQRTSLSPSSRWSREHGRGSPRRRPGNKRAYRSWWWARISAWRLNRRYGDTLIVYACHWGDDYRAGETAERHWHLGHESKYDMWGY